MAGVDVAFVEKPPTIIQVECPICLLVLRKPYQASCCGYSYCKECIEQVKTCPACKNREFNIFPNKGLERSVNDLKVYCSLKDKGCEWRGELRELDNHLNSEPSIDLSLEGCLFTVIKCPLYHTGCKVKLPRKNMKEHMSRDWLGHALKQTALVETLSAQFQSIQEDKKNLQQQVIELQQQMRHFKLTVNTGQPIGPVELTMTNFDEYQKHDERWRSSPFYTHPHGYKMHLCVSPNGYGSGKGTHLGVTIHLMRGEFDDHLKWPFRGSITILLVDQERGRNHIIKVVRFDHDNIGCTRVMEEFNSSGRGIAKVITLSILHPEYLRNDCIKLHVPKIELLQ